MWGAIIPAAASIFGSIMQAEGQEDANDANRQIQENNNAFNAQQAELNRAFNQGEAAENRNFQLTSAREQMQFQQGAMREQMGFQQHNANTVWQRGIEDMKAAGLNPMLAYRQGGNPTATGSAPAGASASGAQASGSPAFAGSPGNQMNKFANAAQSASQIAQIRNIEAQTERTEAETQNIKDENPHIEEKRAVTRSERTRIDTLVRNISQDTELKIATKYRVMEEINKVKAEVDKIGAEEARTRIQTILEKYDIPRMHAESLYFKTPVGKTSPHNKYGPQTPFRLLEGIGERILNDNSANAHRLRLYPPDGGPRKPW